MSVATAEKYGIITEAGSIVFERLLPGPIERVWDYLTDPDKRALWLAGGSTDLGQGRKIELFFHHSELAAKKEPIPERFKSMEKGVTLHCQVTACEKPHRLSYLFGDDGSEVTFELKKQGSDVLLTLTHRRLPNREKMLSVAGGWHTHLGLLVDHFAGRPGRGFWSNHAALEKEYDRMIKEM